MRQIEDVGGTLRLRISFDLLAPAKCWPKPRKRSSASAPATTRSDASRGHLRPPAAERLSADGAVPSTANRLRADTDERPEGSPVAERLGRTYPAERCGRSQSAWRRRQRGRRSPTRQSPLDQHSRFFLAVQRLSDWRPAPGWIDALERRLSGTKPTDPRG